MHIRREEMELNARVSLILVVTIVFACSSTSACPAKFHASSENSRPIIGILTEPTGETLSPFGKSYLAASYVKWIESAGARVVPIFYNSTEEELRTMFSYVNGVLFPGGGTSLDHTKIYNAGKILYDLVIEEMKTTGQVVPLHGTCLGFELICVIASGSIDVLSGFDAENISLPLDFTPMASESRLFGLCPSDVLKILSSEPVTMNNHRSGVSNSTFYSETSLSSFFNVLSMNRDRQGKKFISTIEGKDYPIQGSQWHPEKPQFEWNPKEGINHGPDSIQAMQWFADYFVSVARGNNHKFPSEDIESQHLIYNYSPVYTENVEADFEQCYFF